MLLIYSTTVAPSPETLQEQGSALSHHPELCLAHEGSHEMEGKTEGRTTEESAGGQAGDPQTGARAERQTRHSQLPGHQFLT